MRLSGHHALFVVLLAGACSIDESSTGDGGADASSDATTSDAPTEAAAKDAGSDVVTIACDGGATTCSAPSDCPAQATACVANVCASGCCATANADAGTACTNDGGAVCDGVGHCVKCNVGTDCTSPTACQVPGCTNHACTMTNASTGTACNDDGGKVCDGTGVCVACNQPSDCTAQTTSCKTNTCASNNCGTVNAAQGTACNDNGGKVCDGTGVCVACNQPSDCPAQVTVCKTNTCSGNNCGSSPAAQGTACTDNGGIVCDGMGACVMCNTLNDCLAYNDAGTLVCTNHICQ